MINDFNAFYKPYLRSVKIKNIYHNQFKHNNYWFNTLYCMIFFQMIACAFFICNSKHYFLSLAAYILSVLLLYFFDKKALKNCIKYFTRKYKVKFLTLSPFDRFKYYLWKEELRDTHLSFSTKKALQYLEIELNKFKNERKMPAEYLLILSSISLVAFWKIFDDINLTVEYKVIVAAAICYASYRYVTLKFYFFSNKQKELLVFKEYLLRLKSEFS